MINSILTPVITAYYIKTDTGVYKTGGLVDNIFLMSITNAILPPILVLFDPYYFFIKIVRCFKSTKSIIFFMQEANYIELKRSTICFTKEFNSRLDILISILSMSFFSFVFSSHCSLSCQLSVYLAIFLCSGLKSIVCFIGTNALCLELISSIRQYISGSFWGL